MEVAVRNRIRQVEDGTYYKGFFKIGEVEFYYEFKLAVPIPELKKLGLVEDIEEAQRIFQVNLKRKKREVQLTDREFDFFRTVLFDFAAIYYYDRNTRMVNEGRGSAALKGTGLSPTAFRVVSMDMVLDASFNFGPELSEMLSSDKFGRALIAKG